MALYGRSAYLRAGKHPDTVAERLNQTRLRYLLIAAVACLTAVALAFRLLDLGALGFVGDEETTALAARSLAEGSGSVMPTGLPYRRALPFTWLNAASASLGGLDSELSYRLPSAVLGAGTVLLIYFVAASIGGPGAGLFASLIMALSGWHLVWSRTARMYSPALLVALGFFFVCLRWQHSRRNLHLALATALFLLAVFLHSAAISIALFPILLALLYDGDRVSSGEASLAAGFMVAAGWLLDRFFVVVPYERWASELTGTLDRPASRAVDSIESLLAGISTTAWPLLLIGLVAGVLWARQSGISDSGMSVARRIAVSVLAALAVSTAFVGFPVVSVTFAVSALVVDRRGLRVWISPFWTSVFMAGAVIGTGLRVIVADGGIRAIVLIPFPYVAYLAGFLPGLVALFGIGAVWLTVIPPDDEVDDRPLRASLVYVLAYCLALGFVSNWAPWRYLLLVYPWIVLVVSVALWKACESVAHRLGSIGPAIPGTIVGIGLAAGGIGGHGLPAARVVVNADYSSRIPWNDQGMEIRPDHQGAGLFVRQQLAPGDIVIAEDALEQRWYTGRTDRWFRSRADARKFLFRDENGTLRDFYVGSVLQDEPLDPAWIESAGSAIWFITSGETALNRDWYLSPEQAAWLEKVEETSEPAYSGRDGLTYVFCFGRCPAGVPVARIP